MSEIEQRVAAARQWLVEHDLEAFVIPRADEYLGEYVPVHNERLKWMTGFTGSAGMAVIARDKAAIFVDGRYTEQVRSQAPSPPFDYEHILHKHPKVWLVENMAPGARIGFDPRLHPLDAWRDIEQSTSDAGLEIVALTQNPVDELWIDRPAPPVDQALLLSIEYTGKSSVDKRTEIAAEISEAGADSLAVFELDALAWLMNIRGNDVPHLPVIMGCGVLYSDGRLDFFTDPRKLPNDFAGHVGEGVTVHDESRLGPSLSSLPAGHTMLADPLTVNAAMGLAIEASAAELVPGDDPILIAKAKKNDTELRAVRSAHIDDGAAVSRFLKWIEDEAAAGRMHDEAELADRLKAFRQDLPTLHDLSFSTISAPGGNAALPHYSHLNGTPAETTPGSLYLVDSGGQYPGGTTDITRTVAIGAPTDEHRDRFTRVLRGHIALAMAQFPAGTTGVQLDILARQFLWQAGLDYDHGTGHGVGSFLSVHEGPQRIAKTPVKRGALLPGMVLSNEPGYYQPGDYGIRCENLMAVVTLDNGFLAFETVTFAPFDLRLVDTTQMSPAEIGWLDAYHEDVYNKLALLLNADDKAWLRNATRPAAS